MRRSNRGIVCLFFFLTLSINSYASSEKAISWFSKNTSDEVILNVDLYESSTCPHCLKAESFFSELSTSTQGISLHKHVINKDKEALNAFFQQLQHFHSNNFSVPTIVFCNSRWLGFDSADTTGKVLVKALRYCQQRIKEEGVLSKATEQTLQKWSATGPLDIQIEMSSISFATIERVVVTAFVDAFSPCSLFCFFVFLSFIWMHPKWKMVQFVLGGAFILTLGLLHYIQLNVYDGYQLIQKYQSWPSALSGAALLVYAYYYRKFCKSEEMSISWKWAVPLVIICTAMVFVQQQVCEWNVGVVFSQWLQTQTLTPAATYLYQFTYLILYLFSMALLLGFYLLLGVHSQAILSFTGWILLMIIGVLLLFYPKGLSYLGWSCAALAIAFAAGWWGSRRRLLG